MLILLCSDFLDSTVGAFDRQKTMSHSLCHDALNINETISVSFSRTRHE
jgi:hypothetical protein